MFSENLIWRTINIKFINRLKAKQVIKNIIQGADKGTMV